MSCIQPYSLFEGETRRPTVTVRDVNGDIQNLAGAVAEFQVKPLPGDADTELVISKTSPVGVTILDQTVGGDTEGQLTITIDPADTTGRGGNYFYDVKVTLANGDAGFAVSASPFTILSVVNG